MRLLRIDGGKLWEVLAIEDKRGESVWTWLNAQNANQKVEAHAAKMRYLLREYVPRNGLPQKRTMHTVFKKRGGLGELKTGPKQGPKLRVFYFFAGEKRIICTHACWKASKAVPKEIDRAEDLKGAFERTEESELRVRNLNPHRRGGFHAVPR